MFFMNEINKSSYQTVLRRDRVYEGNYGMGSTDYADGYFDPNFYYFENMNYYDSEQTNRGPFMKLNMYSKYVSGNLQ